MILGPLRPAASSATPLSLIGVRLWGEFPYQRDFRDAQRCGEIGLHRNGFWALIQDFQTVRSHRQGMVPL